MKGESPCIKCLCNRVLNDTSRTTWLMKRVLHVLQAYHGMTGWCVDSRLSLSESVKQHLHL